MSHPLPDPLEPDPLCPPLPLVSRSPLVQVRAVAPNGWQCRTAEGHLAWCPPDAVLPPVEGMVATISRYRDGRTRRLALDGLVAWEDGPA